MNQQFKYVNQIIWSCPSIFCMSYILFWFNFKQLRIIFSSTIPNIILNAELFSIKEFLPKLLQKNSKNSETLIDSPKNITQIDIVDSSLYNVDFKIKNVMINFEKCFKSLILAKIYASGC